MKRRDRADRLPNAGVAGFTGLILAACLAMACSGGSNAAPEGTTPPSVTAAPAASPEAAGPRAPSNVGVSGALPNLRTPVPPGQGELGRFTISWTDNSTDEAGFRIYQDCQGTVTQLIETPPQTTQYGPLQACRPGRVGVAAFNARGTSDIVWAP